MDKSTDFKKYLSKKAEYINLALKKFLPKDDSIISQSMRYSVLSGGKRLRPILVILTASLFGVKTENVIHAACAVEYLHTYSLVHDDLPAMDNDDFRRGLLSNHKKFGEAIAVLCGDALLTESFNLITKSKSSEKNINLAVRILSYYCGYKGMIAGQVEDSFETGKWRGGNIDSLNRKLQSIQLQKTGALIVACLKIGAVLAGANNKSLSALEFYGTNIGVAFQITDDILDAHDNKNLFDKKSSDLKNDKLTTISMYGKCEAEKKAIKCVKRAKKAVSIFGNKSELLIKMADYVINRAY
ncbi:MAG: polyprenyl synthetase family protein, partial [Endomicrobium sp.]|nr:polyprenyl synthetase family protein [Endomicrobium sp.]